MSLIESDIDTVEVFDCPDPWEGPEPVTITLPVDQPPAIRLRHLDGSYIGLTPDRYPCRCEREDAVVFQSLEKAQAWNAHWGGTFIVEAEG